MNRLNRIIVALAIMVGGFGIVALLTSNPLSAAPPSGGCTSSFLSFPAWYDGLLDGKCNVKSPDVDSNGGGLPAFIFRIVLNIIEIALQLIAYAAAGYIIYGGFKYLTSAGSADRIASGRKIIQNSVIGLVISFMSVAVVNLVTTNIDGSNPSKCSNTSIKVDADCVGVSKVNATKAIDGILTTAYYAAGTVAVVVIIISAFFYTTSQGDPSKTKRAKDGILYAVVGLVVVLSAFIITNFVIGKF